MVKEGSLIKKEMLITDIIEKFPSTREVFAKHGVCSGGIIPRETLEFFSRAHQVNLEEILVELNKASHNSSSTKPETTAPRESIGEVLWRRFFKFGIVFGSIGWAFGAVNLAYIAFRRSYFELRFSAGWGFLLWVLPTRPFPDLSLFPFGTPVSQIFPFG